jgi:hypothetical protein
VAHPVLRSIQPEPAGDLFRRPAHRKVVVDMLLQRAQALDANADGSATMRSDPPRPACSRPWEGGCA